MNTSINYSHIRFEITNNAERYFYITYFLFGTLSSLIGDTLILYASFQKHAFKINKIIVTIIQHLAVSDLASAIFGPLPKAISMLANSWILGEVLCYIRVYIVYSVFPAGICLIAMLTTTKWLILRYPVQATRVSTRRVHQVCSLFWVFSLSVALLFLVVDKEDVYFDYRFYVCEYGFSAPAWKQIMPIVYFICPVVPIIVIVGTTVPTLKYLTGAVKSAKQAKGSVPWQGALTVVLTSVVYCISILPYIVYKIVCLIDEDQPEWFRVRYARISYFLLTINITSNFFIYTLTVKSFRKFLLSKVMFHRVEPAPLQPLSTKLSAAGEQTELYHSGKLNRLFDFILI